MDGSRIREMVKKNIGPELSFKIWIWQETGSDELVNGFIDINNPGVVEEIQKEGVEIRKVTDNIFSFRTTPVSRLAEIAGLNGVQYIEIELLKIKKEGRER